MKVKKIILTLFILFLFLNIYSQAKFYGIYGGGVYFDKESTLPDFAFGTAYEDYLDARSAVRLLADFSFPNLESGKTFFWDLKAQYEYNFNRFGFSRSNKKFTPFVAGGVEMMSVSPQNGGYNIGLPITGGLKFIIGQSIIISLESSFVWTNFSFLTNRNVPYNINWYGLAGLHIMFNFYKEEHLCPAY